MRMIITILTSNSRFSRLRKQLKNTQLHKITKVMILTNRAMSEKVTKRILEEINLKGYKKTDSLTSR
jgi:hypothetical protein